MLDIKYTSKFKRDYRRVKRQGRDMNKLFGILKTLQRGEKLPDKNRDHDLYGAYRGHRECHIEPDWLLIYRIDEGKLTLTAVRTGSHSDVLGL